MTVEEFVDFYTEGSFAVRDAEVQFKVELGKMLIGVDERALKFYARAIKRHVSFLKECIVVASKWEELQKHYTKNKSWSDLVKEAGFEKEKRPRLALKKVIASRIEMHKKKFEETGDVYYKGRLDEDQELIKEEQYVDDKNG